MPIDAKPTVSMVEASAQKKTEMNSANVLSTEPKLLNLQGAIRIGSYLAIWLSYLAFMSNYAPNGIAWLSWHLQRVYNAVQYVKINGLFTSFGFSIWSSCQDCGFSISEWAGKIYLSRSVFKLFPYIIVNNFFGLDALQKYGPQIDRLIIFIAAAATAELIIICVHEFSLLPKYFVGIVCFVLFATTPWTYKMLLSSWSEIYFLSFFMLGMLFFAHQYFKLGLLMLFIASFFHYQWGLAIAGLYGLIYFCTQFIKNDTKVKQYLPANGRTVKGAVVIILLMTVAILFEIGLRWLATRSVESAEGSSLLFRIGIQGNDIHNGGLLGALQFLGGGRVTRCLAGHGSDILSADIMVRIAMYNCILSIVGMFLLSLFAIVGLVILLKKSSQAKWIVFPLAYGLLLFISILQQSMSVHLVGYSYIFSFLFAAGTIGMMVFLTQFIESATLRVILSIPCVVGIVLLSIRVSMLTGVDV